MFKILYKELLFKNQFFTHSIVQTIICILFIGRYYYLPIIFLYLLNKAVKVLTKKVFGLLHYVFIHVWERLFQCSLHCTLWVWCSEVDCLGFYWLWSIWDS